MKRRAKTLLLFLATVGMLSCQKELTHDQEVKDVDHVTMFARDFALGQLGPQTKTALTISGNVAEFSWKSTDIVGVFPDEGTQVRFPILSGHIEDGTSTSEANFTGCGWAVKKQHDYMAYYPFVPDMDMDKTAIPVTFAGQVQKGNVNTDHIEHFDYMAAALQSPTKTGEIAFHFEHLGCLFEFVVKAPKAAEYTSVSLVSNGQFVIDGKYDLTAEVPAIEAVTTSNELVLSLEDVQTTEPNEELKLYMMMAPVDLSGQDIIVRLKGPHAEFEVNLGPGTNFKAGKFYRPSLSGIQGGDIIMLEDGSSFCYDIKTLANGEDFPADKNDYMIRHIQFETDNADVPDGVMGKDFCDVSLPDSPAPIYAIWDVSTRTITIRTGAHYVYSGRDASSMLTNMKKLASVNFDGFSSTYMENASSLFQGCEALTSLDFSGFDCSALWDAQFMFNGCSQLESISGLILTNPCITRYMFWGCSKIKSLDLTGWHLSSDAGEMFRSCDELETINLTDVNIGESISINAMFRFCSKLKVVDLSSFNGEAIRDVNWLFEGCTSLHTIVLPDPLGSRELTAFWMTFSGCRDLKNVNLSAIKTYDVGTYSGMFGGCESLEEIDAEIFKVTTYTKDLSNMFAGCKSLKSLALSSWNTSAVQNFSGLFSDCTSLSSIDISPLNTVAAADMSFMFSNCCMLSELNLSTLDTEGVTNLSGMFQNCTSLQSLDISSLNTQNVNNMSGLFEGCTSLTSIDLSTLDAHNVITMSNMFARCKNLTRLDLSTFSTDNLTNVGDMFSGCTNLETVNITGFKTGKVGRFDRMFYDCENLQEIKGIEDLDTHFSDSFPGTFGNCKSLERLDLSKWQTAQASVIHLMFSGCEKLKYLDISGFSTENMRDGGRMFMGMHSLETLKLGDKFVYSTNGLGPFNEATQTGVNVYCSRAVMSSIKNDNSNSGFWYNNNFYDFQTNALMKAAGSDVEL